MQRLSASPLSSIATCSRCSARRFSSHASKSATPPSRLAAGISVGAAVLAYVAYYTPIRLDTKPAVIEPMPAPKDWKQAAQLHHGDKSKGLFLFGSNRYGIVDPANPGDPVKRPVQIPEFAGQSLRDLSLSEKYAVAVDHRGDLYMWGTGYSSATRSPQKSLAGKNIVSVATTPTKIYALSKKGVIWCLSSNEELQKDRISSSNDTPVWYYPWTWLRRDPGVDVVRLTTDTSTTFSKLAAGSNHVLALTSRGEAYAIPVNSAANAYGQLALRKIDAALSPSSGAIQELETIPSLVSTAPREIPPSLLQAESSICFCTKAYPIPSLKSILFQDIKAGNTHSLALTKENRLLGWGNNAFGQLGLGTNLSLPIIPTPTEASMARAYGGNTRAKCIAIEAAGDYSAFLVENQDIKTGKVTFDLLTAGNGQFGQIGNGQWAHQSLPTRVKALSSLTEFSDALNKSVSIPIYKVSLGPGHAVAVLDNAIDQKDAKYGRDAYIWGLNDSFQLGNLKRSNSAVPQHMTPLPYPRESLAMASDVDSLNSGSTVHMPHNRLQLSPKNRQGVEETIVAGHGTTAVYWRCSA